MKYIYMISWFLLLTGIALIIIAYIKNKNNKKINLVPNNKKKYAILIPARNESKVIRDLLDSLKDNKVNFKDVYVIVEDNKDKTINIVNEYGGNIFIRTNLNNRHRKGYALDECLKDILSKKKKYDLYFIFDADNIVNKGFFKEMIKTYNEGYKIAIGYRNIKNSENVITTCSILTFSMINTLINKRINKIYGTIIISGTGFYISGELIDQWNGYPFHSLTEDYELSLYASANEISTYYNELAEFNDEQPNNWNTSIKQRTRWVKGFFEARKKRLNDIDNDYIKLLGITPILFLLFGIITVIIISLGKLIQDLINNSDSYIIYLNYIIFTILSVYIALFIFSLILILKERKRLKISLKMKIQAILFNPIFLLSYIICLIRSLTTNVTWDVIKHGNDK